MTSNGEGSREGKRTDRVAGTADGSPVSPFYVTSRGFFGKLEDVEWRFNLPRIWHHHGSNSFVGNVMFEGGKTH